jgi:hypothetical protein
VVSQADADALVPGLTFRPATDLDGKFALAMLLAASRREEGHYAYEMHQQAQLDPKSPRPMEALAVLAMVGGDTAGAATRWERARELGTDNPYAYLLPAREELRHREFYFTLKAQLPEGATTRLRAWLERCVQLDPGSADAHFSRAIVEAFAAEPDPAALDAIERSHTLALRPHGCIYVAVARWRLGATAEAHRLLAHVRMRQTLSPTMQKTINQVEETMRNAEKATASGG